MKRFLYILTALFLTVVLFTPVVAHAEIIDEDDTQIYTLFDENGNVLMQHAGRIYVDDEYISAENMLYRVISVDDVNHSAIARLIGFEPFDDEEDSTAFAVLAEAKDNDDTQGAKATANTSNGQKKLISMYSTHSDESYEPSDGTSSKINDAGIYDVGDALKKELEKLGVTVTYSKEKHLPHDAGAYRRSRRTAEELLKAQPAALLDIHRDGIPDPGQYTGTVDGEAITKVRLLVGRSNPSASANRTFAKQIKKVADKKYPGLIKDIFVGKGNYNQELYPKSILLEFGTHTTSKEKAIKSTAFIADVLNNVIFGGSAEAAPATPAAEQQEQTTEENKSGSAGIAWFIGVALVAAIVYGLVATGTLKGMTHKMGRGVSEITGGLIGKKPDDHKDE